MITVSTSYLANYPRATPESHPGRRRWLGTSSYWLAQLVGWSPLVTSVVISIFLTQHPFTAHLPVIFLLLSGVVSTHLYRVYLIRLRGGPHTLPSFLLRVFAGLTVLALVGSVLLGLYDRFNTLRNPDNPPRELFDFFSVLLVLVILVPWVGFYLGINYYRSYRQSALDRLRLEAAVNGAELRLLRAQVDPHFLFNSLNTLRALIPEDAATPKELSTAREAVSLLSEVLRTSLLSGTSSSVPLEKELEHVENFLALEKLRFESRFQFAQAIAPATLGCPVPPLLLQTLVENAVKYGIATRESGGLIRLSTSLEDEVCVITITNPGTLNSVGASTGLGLKNARARLALIFGSTATLDLAQIEPDLVRAVVRIPTLRPPLQPTSP